MVDSKPMVQGPPSRMWRIFLPRPARTCGASDWTPSEMRFTPAAAIYIARGLDPTLAKQVAHQLMAHDALGAHARDELGISAAFSARPIQAALASAGSFAVGAAMPLLVTALAPEARLIPFVSGTSLVFLALLGGLAARVGGAGVVSGAIRVTFWGALAMAVTAGIGALFGTATT